jgi:hypothetical protein
MLFYYAKKLVKGLFDLGVGMLCLRVKSEVCCAFVLVCCLHMHCAYCWVHIPYLGWINSVHTTKCVVNVNLVCFLFDILTWAFMFKLPKKVQPLKNFKYKYLFDDKIPKGNCAFSGHIHVDVLPLVPFPVEHHCEIMDLDLWQSLYSYFSNSLKHHLEFTLNLPRLWKQEG